jgi:hypothetical protein
MGTMMKAFRFKWIGDQLANSAIRNVKNTILSSQNRPRILSSQNRPRILSSQNRPRISN